MPDHAEFEPIVTIPQPSGLSPIVRKLAFLTVWAALLANLALVEMNRRQHVKMNALMVRAKALVAHVQEEQRMLDGLAPWPTEPFAEYALIHMPKGGKCPLGFLVADKAFERDGVSIAGCVRPELGHGGAIDVIHPGESVSLDVLLPSGRVVPNSPLK
jgi:hypothetical protein